MPPQQNTVQTKVIDNFGGRLTRVVTGDMNSGFAKYSTTYNNDPFTSPQNLTWNEVSVRIDSGGSVITDLIVAGKERVESGISYVYAVGHTARVYKIQVNNPTNYNPNYDNPVLLTTLATNSPTFTRGGSLDFFGSTERIYIGHDKGMTYINFDGTSETFIGTLGSWTQNVPRPQKQFAGNLYVGNGNNIAKIVDPSTVSSYTQLSPGFPSNTQVRDIDQSIDGNYLKFVVSRLALPDITSTAQDTTFLSNSESYVYSWNGSDVAPTAITIFPAFSLNANKVFGQYEYNFGYDVAGMAIYAPTDKILSPTFAQSPLPNATGSNGNLLGWMAPEWVAGFLKASLFIYGSLDNDVPTGWWRQFQQTATGTETDILKVPFQLTVSDLVFGASNNGYAGNLVGTGKVYFSTIETSATTTKYKFYRFDPTSSATATVQGVYETQTQMFSKKQKITEVRVYSKGFSASNGFKIDLIGSDGNPIPNGSQTFTVGTNVTSGVDMVQYNPGIAPTYALGIRITNTGTLNYTIQKIEVDYKEAGK